VQITVAVALRVTLPCLQSGDADGASAGSGEDEL